MSIQETNLKAIADAIRAKTGETGMIVANDFATKIAAIQTGVAKPRWVQSTMPFNVNWSSVCYGNGKFVAVAYNSNVAAYSTNGNDWTQATFPVVAYCTSVCYGDGKFVAVTGSGGDGRILYSTDGSIWNATSLPANVNWSSVCYGNDKFVIVANGSNIAAYGIGGISWSQTTMPASLAWSSVCYGAGKFVAVVRGSTVYAYLKDYFNEWA